MKVDGFRAPHDAKQLLPLHDEMNNPTTSRVSSNGSREIDSQSSADAHEQSLTPGDTPSRRTSTSPLASHPPPANQVSTHARVRSPRRESFRHTRQCGEDRADGWIWSSGTMRALG
jgi:hypothetical protein